MSVFTPVSVQEITEFLNAYSVGELRSYEGIVAGVENSNFFVNTNRGKFVLTIFEQHDAIELDYFLQLMRYLSRAGVPTARPLHDRSGNLLRELKGKPAALVLRLPGRTISQPNTRQCAEIGLALAQLHLGAMNFPFYRPPDRGYLWRMETGYALLPLLEPLERQLLEQELAYQQGQTFIDLPSGVIHADLFCDNTLFHNDRLSGVLDWYYACNDALLYDLAIVVNDWCCRSDGTLDGERLQACLQAYHKVRPLLESELASWQTVLRAAALRFWLSRLAAAHQPRRGQLVLSKDPAEYRIKLYQRQLDAGLIRTCWPKPL